MFRKSVIGLLACAMGLMTFLPANAETTLKLGWTTADSPLDPYAVTAKIFKEEVERASNNQIVVQLYPNRQLGDERQMLEGLRFGTVDLALITNSVVTQLEPGFQLFDLPFLFSDATQAHKVLDSEIGTAMAGKLESKGIVLLGYADGGFRQMLNNKKPVTAPADVEGVKYRVMQNPMFIEMFDRLGGSAVPMAWGETFTAVQQGTIDGLEAAVPVFYASKFQEVTKYLSLTNHNFTAIEFLMSSRALDKLSPELQAVVREAGARAVAAQRKEAEQLASQALELMQKEGVQVNEIAAVAPFREAVAPIYEKARSVVGAEALDQALEMVK